MDPCYQLIADRVTEAEWQSFSRKLTMGFRGFPAEWDLDPETRERLTLKVQWHFFNPDIIEGIAARRARSWAFMTSFLSGDFNRKFGFLRTRLDGEAMERWDRSFADFETLLLLSSMDEAMQLEWLSGFDGRIRYGVSKRAKVIKNKGLGLSSDLLGVNILMTWPEIRARYRFLLKKNHPDVGGDPAAAQALIKEFERLNRLRKKSE